MLQGNLDKVVQHGKRADLFSLSTAAILVAAGLSSVSAAPNALAISIVPSFALAAHGGGGHGGGHGHR